MFEFQVTADTTKEVQAFMTSARANDVNIEDWSTWSDRSQTAWQDIVHGWGKTTLLPKHLNRLADTMEVKLIFVEREKP